MSHEPCDIDEDQLDDVSWTRSGSVPSDNCVGAQSEVGRLLEKKKRTKAVAVGSSEGIIVPARALGDARSHSWTSM